MLKGKNVLITGSSKGVGRSLALAFAKKGSNIILNARNPISSELISEIEGFGVDVISILADIQYYDQAEELAAKAKNMVGQIDILINCAGITNDELLIRMSDKQFSEVIDVNLKGTFNVTKHIIKIMMKQKKGVIINMSSVSGLVGNIGQSNYSASKAGIIGFTKSVAREFATKNITCNAIAPGLFNTDMTENLNSKIVDNLLDSIPMKRFGNLEDISNTAIFIATSPYITGQVINVDGGMVMND
jgi:3-oxoacyl-[acyl-carrier protein] reductase